MITEAKRRGNKKHMQKLDEIRVRVTKESGEKAAIKAAAKRAGMSLNEFALQAIREKIGREGKA